MAEQLPIVFDGGTGFVKVGYGYRGQIQPLFQFPAIVGRPILRAEEANDSNLVLKDIMCGDEAAAARSLLEITYPVKNGAVQDWDNMIHLWDYTFYEKLGIDTTGRNILLTEPPQAPIENRMKMCEIMYSRYGFSGVFVAVQAVLALYAQGSSTGLVVDSGDGVTHILPVYQSIVPTNSVVKLNFAGRNVTDRLIKLLNSRGYALHRTADFETARDIKEKLCEVSYDLELSRKLSDETTFYVQSYKLPDGRNIQLGSERYEAAECLFQPHLINEDMPGISETIHKVIKDADVDLRKDLIRGIVLSGGTTMIPGFASRLERELKQLRLTETLQGDPKQLNKFELKVDAPPNRRHLVFLGGAEFAETLTANKTWVTFDEFQEKGKNAFGPRF